MSYELKVKSSLYLELEALVSSNQNTLPMVVLGAGMKMTQL